MKYVSSLHIILTALTLMTIHHVAGAAGTSVNDTVKTRELQEVVIEAKKEIHTAEGDVIYLSKKNREFGTSALDAISSLRQFSPVLDGLKLITNDQKPVAIMINGRPSTPQDLRGYTGKEIKKVTYYPTAPPRYADVTDGPLIDVEISVDKNYINAFVSTSNALNAGYGNTQAVIRWADSLNLVRADYFIDYRNLRHDNRDTYIYPSSPQLNRAYVSRSHYKGHYQYGKLSWQNTARRRTIYLSAMFRNNPGDREYDNSETGKSYTDGADAVYDSYRRQLKSVSNIFSLNFFLRTRIGKGRLDIQADGAAGRTSSDNILTGEALAGTSTSFHNNSYNGATKIQYYNKIGKLGYYLTGGYGFQRTDRRQTLPVPSDWSTDNNTATFSASVSGSVKKGKRWMTYNLGLAADYRDISRRHTDISVRHWGFTPHFTLGTLLSDKFYMRLRGTVSTGAPTIGQITVEPTYQERNLVWTGNPDLKAWTKYQVSLQPEYWIKPGKIALNGDFSYSYTRNPIAQCAFMGEPVEIRTVNLHDSRHAEAVVNITLLPTNFLRVTPYLQWSHDNYRTPNRHVDRGYLRYGGSVSLNRSIFQAVFSANAPYRLYRGDITDSGGWQFDVTALARLPKGFSVSLSWNRSYQNDRKNIYAPGIVDYVSDIKVPRMGNMIKLGVTWSFSHGVFRKRTQPQVEDTATDSGLTDYNEAKM